MARGGFSPIVRRRRSAAATGVMDKQGDRLNMLQRNNQQLSAELARVREENRRLEQAVTDCRAKQTEYMDTIAAVDRTWSTMTEDMQYLGQRMKGFADGEVGLPDISPASHRDTQANGLQDADPFLRGLLGSASVEDKYIKERLNEMADDATDVEKALMPRSAAVLRLFVALLELQDREATAKQSALLAATQGSDLASEIERLTAEVSSLRKAVDVQKAKSRTAEAQKRQLADMLRKDEIDLQGLKNELADRKEELNAANRKLHTLKGNEGSLISQPSLPLPISRRGSMSPSTETDGAESSKALQKELKMERDRADSVARQLRDLQAKIQEETFVSQTNAFLSLQRQMQAQSNELDKARKMAETLQRECEGLKHNMQGLYQQAEDARHLRRLVHLAEERIQELEVQVANARKAQEIAELDLQKERQKMGHSATVQELQSMVSTLEREAENNRGSSAKRQTLLGELDRARADLREAVAKLEAKDLNAKETSDKLAAAEAELSTLKAQQERLKAVSQDLRIFVEVLQTFCDDPRDLAEVRTSEAKLKSQLTEVQTQLKGHELQVAVDEAKKLSSEAQQQASSALMDKATLELETADLRRQCEDLKNRASTLTADIEAYTTEMEVIGAAYEDMQAKNSRLLQQLAEKDGKASQVLTEKIQAQHQATAQADQQQQAEAARKLAEQQVAVLQERVAALEAKLQERLNELGQAMERVTLLGQQVEKLCSDLRERDLLVKQRDSQLQTLQQAADHRKRSLDEEAEKSQRERTKRARLEDDYKTLQAKVGSLEADGSSSINEDLRLRVRCQVCQVRTKDTVITKCWHTFCGDCIKRNLEARNRKCPTCGHLFGAPDVKMIYL